MRVLDSQKYIDAGKQFIQSRMDKGEYSPSQLLLRQAIPLTDDDYIEIGRKYSKGMDRQSKSQKVRRSINMPTTPPTPTSIGFGKFGTPTEPLAYKPAPEVMPKRITPTPRLGKELAKTVPYLGVQAVKGVTAPITAVLEPFGVKTGQLLEEAAQYWKPDIGKIPDITLEPGKGFVGTKTEIADILGATAGGLGAILGPIRAGMTAGKLITELPALEKAARPFYRDILAGMIGGALIGEGKVDETLSNAALFGVFSALPYATKIPNAIKNTTTWRKAGIKERGLMLQSLEDTIAKNPNMTEVEILRTWRNPAWIKEAISRRNIEQLKEQHPNLRPGLNRIISEDIKTKIAKEMKDAESIRRKVKEAGIKERADREKKEQIRIRRTEKDRLEAEQRVKGEGIRAVKPAPEAVKAEVDKFVSVIESHKREEGDLDRGLDFFKKDIESLSDEALNDALEWTRKQTPWMHRFLGGNIASEMDTRGLEPYVIKPIEPPPEAPPDVGKEVTPVEPKPPVKGEKKPYFTVKKAQDLVATMTENLTDAQLQKHMVKLRDYNRYINEPEVYGKHLAEGGYFVDARTDSTTGVVPKDMWLSTDLRNALDETFKEISARKKPIPTPAKEPVVEPRAAEKVTVAILREARKYKSAEEFVKTQQEIELPKYERLAQDTFYHYKEDAQKTVDLLKDKAQLTDIWNKAQKKVTGVKEKQSWEMGIEEFKQVQKRPGGKSTFQEDIDRYKKVKEAFTAGKLTGIQLAEKVEAQARTFHKAYIRGAISEGKIASHPDYPELGKAKPVPKQAVTRDYGEYWDTKLKLGRKVNLAENAGWISKSGKLTKLGAKIAESRWEELSPAAQNVLKRHIENLYDVKTPPPKAKPVPEKVAEKPIVFIKMQDGTVHRGRGTHPQLVNKLNLDVSKVADTGLLDTKTRKPIWEGGKEILRPPLKTKVYRPRPYQGAIIKEQARTFRAWVRGAGGVSTVDPMHRGTIQHISAGANWQPGVKSRRGLHLDELLAQVTESGKFPGINTIEDVMNALQQNPYTTQVMDKEIPLKDRDYEWLEEQERDYKERMVDRYGKNYEESEGYKADLGLLTDKNKETIKRQSIEKESKITGLSEKELGEHFDESGFNWVTGKWKDEEGFLKPTEPTPYEVAAELEKQGIVKRPERVSKKAVFPEEGIKTIPGKQRDLFGVKKGETYDLFDQEPTLSFMGTGEIVNTVKSFKADYDKAKPYLIELGQRTYAKTQKAGDWMRQMRSQLGDMWDTFRNKMREIWAASKKWYKESKLGEERGVIGGEKAVGAPKGVLAKAERMLAEGKTEKEVWKETGWLKGAEGKWKWEIDDSGAIITPEAYSMAEEKVSLGDILKHDALYKAYPEIKKVAVFFDPKETGGYYNKSNDVINVGTKGGRDKESIKGVVLHEISHAIQEIEGFARGGSPATLFKEATGYYPEFIKGVDLEKYIKAGEDYIKLAGEIEAREVAIRKNLTAEQRRIMTPYIGEGGIPRDQWIVKDGEGTSFSIELTKKDISQLRKDARELKKIRTAKEILDRRRTKVRAVRDYFKLTDTELKSITRKDIRLMSNLEFKNFIQDIRLKAKEIEKVRFAREARKLEEKKEKGVVTFADKAKGDIIKHRKIKGKKGQKDREAPPVTKGEFDIIKTMPDLRSKPLGGWLENPLRTFEELGDPAKELFYRPVKVARHKARVHFKKIQGKIREQKKTVSGKSATRIGTYAIAQQKGGADILKEMGIKEVPKLTPAETKVYNWMRDGLEYFYVKLQEARRMSGKESFGKVENYFTFFRDVSTFEKFGWNPVFAKKELMETSFVHLKTTPFRFARRRTGGITKADLNAFAVYEKYTKSAIDHIHLSPAIAKGREMLLTFKEGKDRYILRDVKPKATTFITEWLDFVAGQKKPQLPKLIEAGINKLNKNLTFSILSANLRSALIQPTAIISTAAELGPSKTLKGIYDLFDIDKYKSAMNKSKVLLSRQFDIAVTEAMEGLTGKLGRAKEITGSIGLWPLQVLDMVTARATWLGAYDHALKDLKLADETQAINYADDTVTRTQASAAPEDLSPAQRTALGKAVTLFQTFVINHWGFLTRDVLGIGNPKITNRKAFEKVLYWAVGAMLTSIFYEDILGVPSPLPAPFHAYMDALEKDDSHLKASFSAAKEITELVPIVGGGIRWGSSPLGAPSQFIVDVGKKVSDRGIQRPLGELVGKGLGVPGTAQYMKAKRILKKGGTIPDAIIGKWPREDKWDIRLRNRKAELNKISDDLEKAEDKRAFRISHSKELHELNRIKKLQKKLNWYRKEINKLKSMEESPIRKKRIQKLESVRTELIKEHLLKEEQKSK